MQHSKCCVVSQPPWVQIPALPPLPPGPIGAGRFCYACLTCGPGRLECRWAAARPRAVRAASFARRVASKPGQAPQASRRPPIGRGHLCVAWPGPAAAHGHRSLALRILRPSTPVGLGVLTCACASARSPAVPSGPSGTRHNGGALHTGGAGSLMCALSVELLSGQAPPPPINFACNSPAACSNIEFASLELQCFRMVSKSDRRKLCATLVSAVPAAAFGCWGRTLRPFRRSSSQRRWGVCSIRSWLSACRRRVAPLMTPFPPFGGSVSVAGGGVAPKVQTASAKNAHNERLRMRWSAFWAQQCLAWGARL